MELVRLVASVCLFAFLVAGCDKLFPELNQTSGDLAVVGDGGADLLGVTQMSGKVCVLSDLRAPASCQSAAPYRHVTIEETRAAADVAVDGTFTISLVGVTDKATFAVTDGVGSGAGSMPTVSVYSGSMLALARAQGIALPVVRSESIANMQLENGSAGDPLHGAVLTWLVGPTGASVAGATAARITGAIGPLYDAQGSAELVQAGTSGSYGVVSFLDLVPGNVNVAVSVPSESPVIGDNFTLAVRGGAITVAALQLRAR